MSVTAKQIVIAGSLILAAYVGLSRFGRFSDGSKNRLTRKRWAAKYALLFHGFAAENGKLDNENDPGIDQEKERHGKLEFDQQKTNTIDLNDPKDGSIERAAKNLTFPMTAETIDSKSANNRQETSLKLWKILARQCKKDIFRSRNEGTNCTKKWVSYSQVSKKIYEPLGFFPCKIQNPSKGIIQLRPRPADDKNDYCRRKFQEYIDKNPKLDGPKLIDQIPPNLTDSFLLNGYVWSGRTVRNEIPKRGAATPPKQWTNEYMEKYISYARDRRYDKMGYPTKKSSAAVILTLSAYRPEVKGKSCLVIGSKTPWAEAIALHYASASSVTTVEYYPINSTHPRVRAIHPIDLAREWTSSTTELHRYDFAISFSSIEHSGLGRYGDPINPWADLMEMEKLRCLVKPNGLLFLGLPLGFDAVIWNVHRIYGTIRLGLMLAGWEILGNAYGTERTISLNQSRFHSDVHSNPLKYRAQPVLILRNLRQTCE